MTQGKLLISFALALTLLFMIEEDIEFSSLHSQVTGSIHSSEQIGYGTEDRQWVLTQQTPKSKTGYPVKVTEEVSIPMRDGVILKGRLFLPEYKRGPFPTIVQLNGYGHDRTDVADREHMLYNLVERGYAALHVSLRGVGSSEGESNLFNQYGQDGYDVIEWAAAQPWSDGHVGTVGISLLGISQWLAAKELPPSLKAISPIAACADCYSYLWYPGGMLPGPGREGRTEYSFALEHRNLDEWWRERTVLEKDIQAMTDQGIAPLVSGGWNDYITPGNIRAFKQIRATGGEGKLIIGPQAHRYLTNVQPYDFEIYQTLWFDHHLKGVDNGIDQEDRVLIYVQGPDRWRFEKDWPIPDANDVELYLTDSKSGSIESINDGSLQPELPAQKNVSDQYTYDPDLGPFLPALLSSSRRLDIDQSSYEAQTLTWTTDPLAVSTEVTGSIKLQFWASANVEDTDFVVQVTDVAPDGTSRQVTTGYLNASRAESVSDPTPLEPGQAQQYTMEILPTSYVFQAGHRIRLSLAGGAKPLDNQRYAQGPGLHPTPAEVEIHQGIDYPSSVVFPVIGNEDIWTTEDTFADVPDSHPFFHEITTLAHRGLINGRSSTKYVPDGFLSRAELSALLVRAFSLEQESETLPFTDVDAAKWYAKPVSVAYRHGLVQGVSTRRFEPHQDVTREQAFTIVARAIKDQEYTQDLSEEVIASILSRVQDIEYLSDYAREGVASLLNAEIIDVEASGLLRPREAITRAEVAQFLYRSLS
ncbi:CocE/NonD family hydrolase [Caldalkalibacillus salinus]|uniref:CocE/NonD family hydrolase n=1 Tax=Caldalkalibacillus salinus TaxID=2803787 RepID=UPI0019220034|nr:CocE/NonD family hydrolase [Caldalkalibacillus salinus]